LNNEIINLKTLYCHIHEDNRDLRKILFKNVNDYVREIISNIELILCLINYEVEFVSKKDNIELENILLHLNDQSSIIKKLLKENENIGLEQINLDMELNQKEIIYNKHLNNDNINIIVSDIIDGIKNMETVEFDLVETENVTLQNPLEYFDTIINEVNIEDKELEVLFSKDNQLSQVKKNKNRELYNKTYREIISNKKAEKVLEKEKKRIKK